MLCKELIYICPTCGVKYTPKRKDSKFCSMHCSCINSGRWKKLTFYVDQSSGCFVVTSHPIDHDGYPLITFNLKHYKVHRFIYINCFGDVPTGMIVRHKCDNPACINPEHLEVGTHQDNLRDKMERERQAKGSKIGISKLKENQVREIKALFDTQLVSEIAKTYHVNWTTIKSIKEGRTWAWIRGDESCAYST